MLLVLGDGLLAKTIADVATDRDIGLVYAGHDEFDVRDHDSVIGLLREYRPDTVINTVATHRVAECEAHQDQAFDINARGAERVARLVPTVYISTDYVFHDGGPHDEVMPGGQPRSVYGRSKLAGELATLEQNGMVVRVSGLYGHHRSHKGQTFPEMVVTGYDPLKLPTDQIFSPTYAPDAAGRILDVALTGKPGGIYHAANAGSTDWAQFAEHILIAANHYRRHVIPYKAHDPLRPRNSALRSTVLPPLRHWRIALGEWAGRSAG